MNMPTVHKCLAFLASSLLFLATFTTEAEARHHSASSRKHARAGHRAKKGAHRHRAAVQLQPEIGALVVTEGGQVIYDHLSNNQFNPASVNKIITAFAAIKTFGLNHQYITTVRQQGELCSETGILDGNLYIQGCDPDFDLHDAYSLRESIRAAGIKEVSGKLILSPDFSYGSANNANWSAKRLQWALTHQGGIKIRHGCAVSAAPEDATQLVEHRSEPLRVTLKEMLGYSQNHVAEQLGRCTGGVTKLKEIVSAQSGLSPSDLQLATASGLGRNRMKPRDMMKVLIAFRGELLRNGLDLQDLLPVAGVDGGTLDERFVDEAERGSVVGKTGTLPGTDGGSSALVGMCNSQAEKLYFVIFCWRGNVVNFRHVQDDFVRKLQAQRGGPRRFEYYPAAEVSRMPTNNPYYSL